VFLSENKKYFEKHNFSDLPLKFVQRIGALEKGKHLKGFVKVQEQLKEIYQNADKYVYSIITEEPMELIELAAKKAKKGINLNCILSHNTIVPRGRKELLKKLRYSKLVADGQIKRKMFDRVKTLVVLNENESCVMFPTNDGEVDMSQLFYSNDRNFHEWCLDYFRYCWFGSDMFQENKIKED
jgi:predicted transcriptional regulator